MPRVVERYRATVLGAERARLRAEADARMARWELAACQARLHSAESALEDNLCRREVAESARASEAAMARAQVHERQMHMQERLDLAHQHIDQMHAALQARSGG